jgi:hypothetical protein
VNIIVKRWQQLKLNIVSSRVCIPPPKEILSTRRLVKTPLSAFNVLQSKWWLVLERELHHEVCLQAAAAPLPIIV